MDTGNDVELWKGFLYLLATGSASIALAAAVQSRKWLGLRPVHFLKARPKLVCSA